MRFLVVEHDTQAAGMLGRVLQGEAHSVDIAADGAMARDLAYMHEYDSIIVERQLPDLDGVGLCKAFRKHGINSPIMMISNPTSVAELAASLDAGADDYLTKPIDVTEFLARTRSLLRRRDTSSPKPLKMGDLTLDVGRRVAIRAGKTIGLTAKEYAILEYFMRTPNIVLSRSRIGEHVWGMDFEDSSNVIEVYISRLRNKIDKGFETPLIHTVIGMGYILSLEGPPAF